MYVCMYVFIYSLAQKERAELFLSSCLWWTEPNSNGLDWNVLCSLRNKQAIILDFVYVLLSSTERKDGAVLVFSSLVD